MMESNKIAEKILFWKVKKTCGAHLNEKNISFQLSACNQCQSCKETKSTYNKSKHYS